jgi:L-fuculokinase
MKSIIIFDIGKTNKKVILYDYSFHVLWQSSLVFPELLDDDNYPCDDIHAILKWMKETLFQLIQENKYEITHMNFSTYGASFVHIDQDGKILIPLLNYTKPIPQEIRYSFYQKHGDENQIALETASPTLDFLNSGLQLYFIKERYPGIFNQITWSLHLPQYLSYYFTKRPFSEYTSIGCHTSLWNFKENNYHKWGFEEKIVAKFPPIKASNTTFEMNIFGCVIQTGIGIHDSSAALYPYTLSSDEPYLLLSTGTWSIVFNPFSTLHLTKEELEKDGLLFLQPDGKPVKAARLFLGNAYQKQLEEIMKYFQYDLNHLDEDSVNDKILNKFSASDPNFFSFPSLQISPTAKADTNLGVFKSFEEAYYRMVWELSGYQIIKINLASEGKKFKRIFLEGGFSKNQLFLACLKKQLPNIEIIISTYSSGASLGAAMQVMGI